MKPLARLKKLNTTAALEFQRLLRAGENAIVGLPAQHRSTVLEILAMHSLTEADAATVHCDLSLKHEQGMWTPRAEWYADKSTSQLPLQARSALSLLNLLDSITSGFYLRQPLEGRLVIRNEILLLWWDLLVIPELESRGHSRAQSRNRSNTNSGRGMVSVPSVCVNEMAIDLLRRSVPRDEARTRLVNEFGFTKGHANKVLSAAGYVAARGRKRRQLEMRNSQR